VETRAGELAVASRHLEFERRAKAVIGNSKIGWVALGIATLLVRGGTLSSQERAASSPSTIPNDNNPATVLEVMTRVADWQLTHPSSHEPWDWTQAAFYTGVMAFARISDNPKYLDAMRSMGERNQWRPGPRPGLADDWAVIATYARLFQIDHDKRMLLPSRAIFDFMLTRPYDEPLTWGNGIEARELAWCDALFMGPPSLAAVGVATGDRRYVDLANRLWWKTTDFLYDKDEHLYFRDSRFFNQREPNGKKVFWSRGNGWVLAGLARMLDDMPADYPDRPRYATLFREMAARIASLQGSDGFWRASLLDPASVPNPETSGTGFFTFALAWGVNHGVLDRSQYDAAVHLGWTALVRAVHPDGMVGWVQRIGEAPGATSAATTEVYGAGAVLLAGSEIYRLVAR
jgi:unsaturated rhamnogalacturonyl hydrolase